MLKKKKCDSILEVIFLIACYTGCRIEEICQLRCTDVHTYEYNNKHRFYLKLAVSKTDKGIGREIPIHSSIHVIIGALKFRKQTNDFLILDGSATSDGERSSKFGKRFGRLKSKLGFGSEHVFHSIRRTFVDQLLANNVDERIAADIVGHEISTMTYGLYGSGTPIDQRFAVVDGISYPKLEKLMKK